MRTTIFQTLVLASALWAAISPGEAARADQAGDQFAAAAAHYDHQQWKLAADEFQTFLNEYPSDRRANQGLFFLGEASLQLGRFDDARRQFQRYIDREPAGRYVRAAVFRSGEAAYLAGNFAAAKPELENFLAKYPRDRLLAFVFPYLGDIALTNHDLAAATRYFSDGLQQFPSGPMLDDCRFGLGQALEKQNQAEEAIRLFLAVAASPGSPLADAAQFHLGALQYAAGRYVRALQSFSAFDDRFAASSWRPNAQLGHALTLLKLGRPADAIKQFDAVLATPSAAADLLQQAARGKIQAALQVKDYAAVDRNVAAFQRRFANSPFVDDVERMLARSLVERKDYARAVAVVEPLLQSSPPPRTESKGDGATAPKGAGLGQQDLENRYLLAVSYEGLKRYDEALAVLLPVVDAARGQLKADAQLAYGSLLVNLKKYAAAIVPLEAFLQANPKGDAAIKGVGELAVCCARTGQLDKAKKLYADLLEKNPQHPLVAATTEILAEAAFDANDTAWSAELSARLAAAGTSADNEFQGKLGLGWSQFKTGRLAEAAATFDELLQKNPPEPIASEAGLIRGQILEQLGRNDAALSSYRLVIDNYPASKQQVDALLAAAQLHEKRKQYQQAAALYQRLAAEHPQFPKIDGVLYHGAWALEDSNRPDDAARLFQRLHKDCPQSRFWADVTDRLADRELLAKHYDAAAALVAEVLDRQSVAGAHPDPLDPTVREYAMFLRGQIAAAQADWPATRAAFQALLKDFPDSPRKLIAEFWIAESYYRQGDLVAAAPRFERLAQQAQQKREPWMAMIPLRRAQLLAQQNHWSDAQAIAAKIAAAFPNFQQQYEVDYLLGRCLATEADFDAARQAYNRVVRSSTGAKTQTAAMAQWMIGETFFHQKNYESALHEYLRLEILSDYPLWQAGGLLQAGKCRQLLGDAPAAAKLYQRVATEYAQTTFAPEAGQRLKSLAKPAPRP